jgi:hypothetical protein
LASCIQPSSLLAPQGPNASGGSPSGAVGVQGTEVMSTEQTSTKEPRVRLSTAIEESILYTLQAIREAALAVAVAAGEWRRAAERR